MGWDDPARPGHPVGQLAGLVSQRYSVSIDAVQ